MDVVVEDNEHEKLGAGKRGERVATNVFLHFLMPLFLLIDDCTINAL